MQRSFVRDGSKTNISKVAAYVSRMLMVEGRSFWLRAWNCSGKFKTGGVARSVFSFIGRIAKASRYAYVLRVILFECVPLCCSFVQRRICCCSGERCPTVYRVPQMGVSCQRQAQGGKDFMLGDSFHLITTCRNGSSIYLSIITNPKNGPELLWVRRRQ